MNVTCGVMGRFYDNKRTIASKAGPFLIVDTILLKNISEGATSYQWVSTFTPLTNSTTTTQTISSNAGGNPNDLNYAFATPGNYNIKLIASNGGCKDSIQDFFYVQDPTPDAFISITNVNCYHETKIQVGFYVCDFGYAPVPINTPITFYDADPTKAGATPDRPGISAS